MENEDQKTKVSAVDFDRTTSSRAPRRPKPLTGMALLLPVLLLGGIVWQSQMAEPIVDANSVMPSRPRATSAPEATVTPDKPATTPTPSASRKPDFVVFLPDDNANLVRKEVRLGETLSVPNNPEATSESRAGAALDALFTQSADFFPKGTALASAVSIKNNVATVNMNAAYAAGADSWSSAETTTRVMSIVNSVAATDAVLTGTPCTVRFLVSGKPVTTLGPLDTSEPLESDRDAVSEP